MESDHYVVETRLKLKVKRSQSEKEGRTRFDMQKLTDEEIRNKTTFRSETDSRS